MALSIGVEIGGTKLQAALGNRQGSILSCERTNAPPHPTAESVLEHITSSIEQCVDAAHARGEEVGGMGIGFGGPVDSQSGMALCSHQVPGWDNFPLQQWAEDRFKVPARVINDANAAGWGEYVLGVGKDTRTFCYMNVGSGIGGALIVDGELHDGQGRGAFEIGHTRIPTESGKTLRLEELCSGWAIERRARALAELTQGTPLCDLCNGNRENITCSKLGEAARMGDTFAREQIDAAAYGIGIAIANAITLVHPERFALGGGVALLGDVLFKPLRDTVERNVFDQYRGRYEVLPAALGEDAVLAGALLLAPAHEST